MDTAGRGKRRSCAFCGSTDAKITKEHVLPDWALRILPPPADEARVSLTRQGLATTDYAGHAVLVNSVCRSCNEGWMSKLEQRARPLLEPLISGDATVRVYSAVDMATMAAWALKTSMVLEYLMPGTARYFTQTQRSTFAAHGFPSLVNTAIWTARCRIARLVMANDRMLHLQFNEGPTLEHCDGYLCTITVNQLALQVLTFHPQPPSIVHNVSLGEEWDRRTIQLWPVREDETILWPPPVLLGETGIVSLSNRWDDFRN